MDSCFVREIKSGPNTPTRAYVGRIMDATRTWVDRGDYYAWDPLAAVALVEPGVVRLTRTRLAVDIDGPFPGWTHRAADGRDAAVALDADRGLFMRLFDAGLGPRDGSSIGSCRR
jgi:inosine-uridine nucleoside N-ribohydrolase